jgi:hypothetical protein
MKSIPLAVLGLAACDGGTDVGNPVDVGFEAHDLDDGTGAREASAANGRVEVDELWIKVRELRIRPANRCEDPTVESRLPAPIAIDLIPGMVPADLDDLAVEAGPYCRLDFGWHYEDGPAGGPPELDRHSIVVFGSRADGTPFVIRSDRGDSLSLDARGGAFGIDDATIGLWIGVDANAWLAGMDFDTAVVGGDGVIRIDDDTNRDLIDLFEDNVAPAIRLYVDRDGDGVLDPEERGDVDAIADGSVR